MGNCLKTQLKEVVNNDNLSYMGCIEGSFMSSSGYIRITGNQEQGNIKIVLENGTIKALAGTGGTVVDIHTVLPGNAGFYVNEEYTNIKFKLYQKYNIDIIGATIYSYKHGFKDFKHCDYLTTLKMPQTGIYNIADFDSWNSIEEVIILDNNSANLTVNGDFSYLMSKLKPNKLVTAFIKNRDIVKEDFDFATVFGKFTKLTEMSLSGVTKCKGTIESFVSAQCTATANPRTTGDINITQGGWVGSVTFGGQAFTPVGNLTTLHWEPNATEGRTDIIINGGTPETIITATGEIVS